MHWKLVTPFLLTKDQPWIHQQVGSPHHDFDVITADYVHDRSRRNTSGREWLDYLRHAARGWFAGLMSAKQPVGYITAFPQLAVFVGLAKRLTGSKAPIVAWFFNLGKTYDGRKGRLAAYCLASVDVFIVYSTREIENYSRMLGLPRERFVFVPFTEELVDPQFTEDPDDPYVLSMGTANRDYRALLQAVATLGLRTIIVAGPHALADLDIPPNVTVRSGLSLSDCHALCQKARVNVVPLDTDETASGQVTVRDAMMFAKAVVATTSIGTEDYIENGVTGILVPPRDPAALAAAIKALWDDPAKRQSLGAAARAWVLANASFDIGPQRLLEVLERIRLARP
jgi:glycosyltransferase involved in cell wall biosynthesis